MSSELAIQIHNLSKCYQIYKEPRHRLLQFMMGRFKQFYQEFWALKNISFSVRKGETVGIVGRNGSGKSTLLQLICGTLNPTVGRIEANGRIAALLELGSGFNPEFTGRENVYLYASILGFSREDTNKNLSEILAFADIGPFIDRPTKTYSSGMVVRLAFSVAIHCKPQILIVDEALAVGDELFQRKCFSKIENIKQTGATILFVSHSAAAVMTLCDRAILIDDGEMLTEGPPKTVVGLYQRLLYAPAESRKKIRDAIRTDSGESFKQNGSALSKQITKPKSLESFFDQHLKPKSTINYEPRGAKITNPKITNLEGNIVNCLVRGTTYRYSYEVEFTENAANITCGMLIKTGTGVELGGGMSTPHPTKGIPLVTAGMKAKVEFEFQTNLNPGLYFLNAGVKGSTTGEDIYLHRILDCLAFRILPVSENIITGIVNFNCRANVQLRDNNGL